jgi:hypothetical protein
MKQNAPQMYGRKEQSWFEACLGPKKYKLPSLNYAFQVARGTYRRVRINT